MKLKKRKNHLKNTHVGSGLGAFQYPSSSLKHSRKDERYFLISSKGALVRYMVLEGKKEKEKQRKDRLPFG